MLELWSAQKIAFFLVVMGVVIIMSLKKASYGYIFLMALVFLRPQDDRPILAMLHVPMLTVIIVFMGLFSEMIRNQQKISLHDILGLPTLKLYLSFVLLVILSASLADYQETAWMATNDFKFITAFYFFALLSISDEKDFKRMIWVMLICGLYFGYLLQFRGSAMMESIAGSAYERQNFMRLNRNFGNPNYLAITMVIMFVFAFGQFLYQKKFLPQLIFLLACPIYIYTLIKTLSRGGTISLTAAVLAFFFLSRSKAKAVVVVIVLIITVAIIVPVYFPSYADRMLTIMDYEEDASATGRLELWGQGVEFIVSNPILGIGPDNFKEHASNSAHNSYLQIASEIGIPGFLIWSMLFFKGWAFSRKAKKIFSRDMERNGSMYYIALSIEISLIACAVQSMFTGMGHREILFMLIAMGVSVYLYAQKATGEETHKADQSALQEA